MTAPLTTRLILGRDAVVFRREVGELLGLTDERADELLCRVKPLRTPGPRGVERYRYGDVLDADAALAESRARAAAAPMLPIELPPAWTPRRAR